jgi:hypothetical protein
MASTLRPIDAFESVNAFVKFPNLEAIRPSILDDAAKFFWMNAPWRWTLGNITALTLTANTSDYTITDPADFLYIQPGSVYLSEGGSDVGRYIEVTSHIHSTVKLIGGQPSQISHPATDTYRVYPKPGTSVTAGTQIIAMYKKQCPAITESTQYTAGTQVFDDEWFWVYRSIVLYFAYLYTDDQRAGGAQSDGKSVTYNGQRGIVEANLAIMKMREPLLVPPVPPLTK